MIILHFPVQMSELTNGGFVNADAAVELASTLKPEAKKNQDKNNTKTLQNNLEKN